MTNQDKALYSDVTADGGMDPRFPAAHYEHDLFPSVASRANSQAAYPQLPVAQMSGDAVIDKFFTDLAARQQPLGPVAAKVLHDNLWDLYARDETARVASHPFNAVHGSQDIKNNVSASSLEWYDKTSAEDELTRDNFHMFALGLADTLIMGLAATVPQVVQAPIIPEWHEVAAPIVAAVPSDMPALPKYIACAAFADNGNVRMWHHDKERIQAQGLHPLEIFTEHQMRDYGLKCRRATIAEYAVPISTAAEQASDAHHDDKCVDAFAIAMKEKLASARHKGRGGWEGCDPIDLSKMLRQHVDKGDPIDVANFCMFLHYIGEPITTASNAGEGAQGEES